MSYITAINNDVLRYNKTIFKVFYIVSFFITDSDNFKAGKMLSSKFFMFQLVSCCFSVLSF
ncbi:hypothetical protein MCY_01363 [Bartonella rattimassiliensis 15908]|uniref:Uncharacterized protein n=1 Tax=Bartonella rattimassiliensis 15908 TaxID=1094556 RepID=J1JL64_9HYPH|nr:hypothetical protein MCY_01363 [Bartonella rattimassiliensis 15908]